MLGYGDSSFTRILGQLGRVVLPALVISGLSLSGAKADPRIDEETGPAMTEVTAPQTASAEEPGPAVTEAAAPESAEDRLCSAAKVQQQGVASWYGRHWRGRKTASGQRYD